MMTASSSQQSSLCRISEDTKLRPFLSPLFDAQAYIKTVIKEGKSEECFFNIVGCIDEINVEIKGYISQHKDDLMSGMQDVAALADRYTNLSITSQKLHRNVGRLKKEAVESYGLVSNRTTELECIHATSILLHQLKQFVHYKRLLDAYLQNPDDTDLRNLSNVARTVSELEKLLQNPRLLEVQQVSDCAHGIKSFGKDIRVLAQDRLLKAITEKNQASIASSLQVFYNLESLPEVILLAIDSAVHRTVESSRSALDIESIQILLHEAPGTGSMGGIIAGAPPSASKKPLATSHSVSGGAGSSSTAAQVRIAVREMAHVWSSMIHEMAMQVHVLQRVVAKKEDPTTHEKFLSVLQNAQPLHAQTHNSSSNASTRSTMSLLSKGLLLDLFWLRLAESLHDVAADKVKHFAVASSRAYPYVRKAAVEILQNLRNWTEGEGAIRAPGSWLLLSDDDGASDSLQLGVGGATSLRTNDEDEGQDQSGTLCGDGGGMFGSLQWTQDDLLNSLSAHSYKPRLPISRSSAYSMQRSTEPDAEAGGDGTGESRLDALVIGDQLLVKEPKEHHLVLGLKPMRDKYLITALGRMSAPIAQMFPELEGYTAAVPSKRDLLALTNAIQAEFATALIESDVGLVQLVSREFLKTIKLMLSKIEGMVLHTADCRVMSAANNFARTHAQVHNASLLVLLVQLKEVLQKIPGQVQTAGVDAASSVLLSTGGNQAGAPQSSAASALQLQDVRDIERAVGLSVLWIEDLSQRQILEPIVATISGHVTATLLMMQKEGVVGALPGAAAASPAIGPGTPAAGSSASGYTGKAPASVQHEASLECSAAVQSLLKHLPVMLKTHLFSLPKCDAVSHATEEVYVRTMHSYVTVAALLRPVTEALRLRAAKDMAALEQLLSSQYTLPKPNDCPVLREFRAFRRLLFLQENNTPDAATTSSTPAPSRQPKANVAAATTNAPPDVRELMKLPYISHLRPSTLLGYLVSCAPPQLPSPFDTGAGAVANASDIAGYVEMLTDVFLTQRTQLLCTSAAGTSNGVLPAAGGVRDLYAPRLDKWKLVANEVQSWALTQQALDTFFQRVSVASGDQKLKMRLWYETIIEVGSRTF